MKKSLLKPLGIRKQEEILRLLASALESAELTRADFAEIATGGSFPTQEREVTKFIRERTRLYRDTWIVPRLKEAAEIIKQNGIIDGA